MRKFVKNIKKQDALSGINLIIVGYFIALHLIYIYKIKHVLIGVFVELLTIPMLLAQFLFLVINIKFLLDKNQSNLFFKFSLGLLIICLILTVSSFF